MSDSRVRCGYEAVSSRRLGQVLRKMVVALRGVAQESHPTPCVGRVGMRWDEQRRDGLSDRQRYRSCRMLELLDLGSD